MKDLPNVHETLGLWLSWYNTYTLGFNNLLRQNHQFHHHDFGGFWVKNLKIICHLKKRHIIDEGKNTQDYDFDDQVLRIPRLLQK